MYYPNLINGHFVESDQKITIISPNNLQPVGKVNSLSPDIINNAFQKTIKPKLHKLFVKKSAKTFVMLKQKCYAQLIILTIRWKKQNA